MGFLKRLAHFLGLAVGVLGVAVGGTVALTYLFTGKVSSVETGQQGTRVKLMTVDEITAMIRKQAAKGRIRVDAEQGGESHGG